ncbi:MAG TPA: UPF0149 family protein [Rhodocyclaceae bacterium]|nr:UPF0149 family protein [Rhodocyclaceae bacterium]
MGIWSDIMTISPVSHPRYRLPALSLSQEEIVELESFLGSRAAPGSLRSLDVLHGYLTCVALSSFETGQEEWLPLVWSNSPLAPVKFRTPAQEYRLTSSVVHMLDDILLSLAESDVGFSPLVATVNRSEGQPDEDGSMWCSGFLLGMAHLQDHWLGLVNLSDAGTLFLPIFLLGSPLLPPAWEDMVRTLDQRRRLTACIPPVVEAIHVWRFAHEVSTLEKARVAIASGRFVQ